MNLKKTGERILSLRKELKLTAENFAELLNVTPQAVSKWENGKCLPETATVIAMADIFGCSIDSILAPRELNIINAVYTDGIFSVDVSKYIGSLISITGRLNFFVGTNIFSINTESERLKVLMIKFSNKNGVFYKYVRENEYLTLDENSDGFLESDKLNIIGAYYGNTDEISDVKHKMEHYEYFKWNEIWANHETFPSSIKTDKTEYLTLVYMNESGINTASCAENDCLVYNEAKTALSNKVSAKQIILPDVVKLGWNNLMDCTWAGALYASLSYMGEKYSYEYIMGVSGACYRFAFTPVWDYSSVDALVAFDFAEPLYKAVGYTHYWADRIDKSERKAEKINIMNDIRKGKPPVAINMRVAPEWGVFTGFMDEGERLLCRTYFDYEDFERNKNNPDFKAETGGYFECENWPFAIDHFDKKIPKPSEKTNLYNSLCVMCECMAAKENRGYCQGFEGFEKWIAGLSDDNLFVSADEGTLEKYMSVNDYQLVNLIDARRCAADYLEDYAVYAEEKDTVIIRRAGERFKEISKKLAALQQKLRDSDSVRSGEVRMGINDKALRSEEIEILQELLSAEREIYNEVKEIK